MLLEPLLSPNWRSGLSANWVPLSHHVLLRQVEFERRCRRSRGPRRREPEGVHLDVVLEQQRVGGPRVQRLRVAAGGRPGGAQPAAVVEVVVRDPRVRTVADQLQVVGVLVGVRGPGGVGDLVAVDDEVGVHAELHGVGADVVERVAHDPHPVAVEGADAVAGVAGVVGVGPPSSLSRMTTSSDLAETWIRLSSVRFDSVPPSRDCSIVIRFESAISVERKRARSVIRDDPDSASAPIDPPPVVPILRTFELVRLLRLTSPTAAVTHTFLPASTAERTCAAVVAVVAPATQDGCPEWRQR